MTCLIATLGSDFAALSQDTLTMAAEDTAALHGSDLDSAFNMKKKPLTEGDKMLVVPHLVVIAGATGVVAPTVAAYQFLSLGAGGARDVLELVKVFPEQLRNIYSVMGELTFWVAVVGYVERHQRAYGFSFLPSDGFRPKPISEGHFISPEVNVEDEQIAELRDRWEPAAEGEDVLGFHAACAGNMDRAQAAGHYGRHGAGIGGRLMTARISAEGIAVKTTYTFAKTTVDGARAAVGSEAPEGAYHPATATQLLGRARAS